MSVRDILKLKQANFMQAPLPAGSPAWSDILDLRWEDIETAAQADDSGFKTIRKLLSDSRFDR
jgi:hypothetical protein